MGCSSPNAKLEELEMPLDFRLNDVEVDELNNFFSDGIEILESIEANRIGIIDKRIELFIETGACSCTNPDIKSCLLGLYYKISCDLEGKFYLAKLESQNMEPYLLAGGELSQENRSRLELVAAYINDMYLRRNNLNEIKSKLFVLKEIAYSTKIQELTNMIKISFSSDQFKIPGLIGKFHSNLNKVRTGIFTFMNLERILNSSERLRDEALDMLKDSNELLKIYEVGVSASMMKDNKPEDIMWCVVDPTERFPTAAKGLKFWTEKLELSKLNQEAFDGK